LEFIAFFVFVTVVCFTLPSGYRRIWLLFASLFFYACAGPIYLVQIAAASAVGFFGAIRIEASETRDQKQFYLISIIIALVANLACFKYTGFVNETLRSLFDAGRVDYPMPAIQLALPLGISFYTFQLLGYAIDVYRGSKPERHFGTFLLFVTFFPKIIAGPIERGKVLLPQLQEIRAFDAALATSGLQLMLWGAFKKFVVADRIHPFVSQVYDAPQNVDGVWMTLATVLYAFQIYFDFSGYTDMALGAACIFGVRLTQNFDTPYFATSIQDFWKRWHISLTSWLTDYLYTPMTRTKRVKIKWYNLMLISLFATFVISGIWHGAQWTFVAWGALHGAYIVCSQYFQKSRSAFTRKIGLSQYKTLHRTLKISTTFALVCFAYILFRANSLADAFHIMTHLGTGWANFPTGVRAFVGDNIAEFAIVLLGILIVMSPDFLKNGPAPIVAGILHGPYWRKTAVYYGGVLSVILLGAHWGSSQQFIYFRF